MHDKATLLGGLDNGASAISIAQHACEMLQLYWDIQYIIHQVVEPGAGFC